MAIVRFVCILLLLLAAACTTSAPVSGPDDGGFTAKNRGAEFEGDPAPSPHVSAEGTALTGEERNAAALLLYELSQAADEESRAGVIEKLVKLGARYLAFLRAVDDPALNLDIAYVISRIEQSAGTEVRTPDRAPEVRKPDAPPDAHRRSDPPRRRGAGGNEGLEDTPHYLDEPGEFDREQVEKLFAARLTNARQALARGDNEGAIRIAQAALTMLPDTRLRPDFEDLILQARAQGQSATLIAGTLSLDPGYLHYAKRERGAEFATPLKVKCYLKNVSLKTLVLTLSDGPGRESVVELNVRYEQLDYQGNSMATEGRVLLPVAQQGEITLAPNESYEITVDLSGLNSLDADGAVKYALGNITVKAALRVFGAHEAEGQPLILRPINFPARTAKVFPSEFNLDAARERPLQAISEAISKNLPQDLFMASQLIEKKHVRAAGELLLGEDLETCALGLQKARMKAMAALTGAGAAFDATKWRAWWAENKFRY